MREPRRILYLVETLEVGGTERQMVETALQLRGRGHELVVGCLRAQGPLLEVLQQASIEIVEFPRGTKLFSFQGFFQLLRLATFLRRGSFDVLHAHDLPANLVGVPAGWLAGTPIIISSRRYLADLDWCSTWKNRIISAIYRLSHYVVVNSNVICDLLVRRDGVKKEKIRVLYNAVNAERFANCRHNSREILGAEGERSKRIAVVANMHCRVKGHACLLAAAEKICREFPEVRFVLIGDGRERPALEEQARVAGLRQNFLFLGARKDVPELLSCCDMSVLPSESEGMPNSVLEAMAAGLAMVATSVGGVPEIITNEVSGLLVPPNDPQALSAAILRLLRDDELRQRLAAAGQESVIARFGFSRLVEKLENLYTPPFQSLATPQHELHANA